MNTGSWVDFGINRGKTKQTYVVNAKRAPKPPVPAPELTWAAHSDPELLRRESFQATACLFSLQPFPSVTADSRGSGEILTAGRAARRGGEGKAPPGSDATGLGSG